MPSKSSPLPGPISSDHELLREILGGSPLGLHQTHHVVLPAARRSLEICLRSVNGVGAVWGDIPNHYENGEPTGPELDDISLFRLWAADVNQRYVLRFGCAAKLGCFTAVIDARTQEDLIQLLDKSRPPDTAPFIDDVLPAIVRSIERLGWSYIPLSDEYPLALFIVSPARKASIAGIKAAALREGIPFSQLQYITGRETWRLCPELRRMCRVSHGESK
ncbi:hypothetical protein [Paludisphaera sp.]|uniref:hypothetical protein n=1 Tax=Paludisphaera sp. TaxID=2017432 RepID=UPI00301B9BD5